MSEVMFLVGSLVLWVLILLVSTIGMFTTSPVMAIFAVVSACAVWLTARELWGDK